MRKYCRFGGATMTMKKDNTAFAGISELRTDAARLLKGLSKHHIIVTKRNRPLGVILDYQDFENIMTTIDELEDALISIMSKERTGRRCGTTRGPAKKDQPLNA